jgi:hypothetical protein
MSSMAAPNNGASIPMAGSAKLVARLCTTASKGLPPPPLRGEVSEVVDVDVALDDVLVACVVCDAAVVVDIIVVSVVELTDDGTLIIAVLEVLCSEVDVLVVVSIALLVVVVVNVCADVVDAVDLLDVVVTVT